MAKGATKVIPSVDSSADQETDHTPAAVLPEAANEQAHDMVAEAAPVTANLDSAIDEARKEIAEAVAVVEMGAQQMELTAVTADEVKRPRAYKKLTPQQALRVAQRRLQEGERLLRKDVVGVAHRKHDMIIRHTQLAKLFKRSYPMCDQAFYTISRHGDDNLGRSESRSVMEMLEKLTRELGQMADESYTQAAGLFEHEKQKPANDGTAAFVELSYNAAFTETVSARSPLANQLLGSFKVIDAAMVELENLHWSNVRTFAEIDDEFMRVKAKVNRIAVVARRTVYAINRNFQETFAAAAPVTGVADGQAAPPASA